MADGFVLNIGSGGDTLAADDIGGAKYQRTKLIYGPDGTNSGDVSLTNPLPSGIQQTVTVSAANSSTANLASAAIFTGTLA